MHNFSGSRKLWMDLPEMHSAGKPLDVSISARCWALREHTDTLKTGNKTRPNNTCQSLGDSLQPGPAFWYVQHFPLHSSGCMSELSFADCPETSQLPRSIHGWTLPALPSNKLWPAVIAKYLLCKFEKTKAWLKGILLNNSCRCWVFSSKVLCGRGWEFTIL